MGLELVGCAQLLFPKPSSRHRKLKKKKSLSFEGVRKKIVLLPFYNESPYGGKDLEVTLTEELRKELGRGNEFVLGPKGENPLSHSKQIYIKGGTQWSRIAHEGKNAGIHFILWGRIIKARVRERMDEIGLVRQTRSYSEAKIEVRIFDTIANKEIYRHFFESSVNDSSFRLFNQGRKDRMMYRRGLVRYAVKMAARKAIPEIMEISSKLNWMGRVAKILGNKIYLNAGRKSGLQVGDILKVLTEGEEIVDPETGKELGMAKGEIKGTIEVMDYFGTDGAIAVLHSGGAISQGDFVQLY